MIWKACNCSSLLPILLLTSRILLIVVLFRWFSLFGLLLLLLLRILRSLLLLILLDLLYERLWLFLAYRVLLLLSHSIGGRWRLCYSSRLLHHLLIELVHQKCWLFWAQLSLSIHHGRLLLSWLIVRQWSVLMLKAKITAATTVFEKRNGY